MPQEHDTQQEPDDKDLIIASLQQQLASKATEVADRERMIYRLNRELAEKGEIIDSLVAKIPDEPEKGKTK